MRSGTSVGSVVVLEHIILTKQLSYSKWREKMSCFERKKSTFAATFKVLIDDRIDQNAVRWLCRQTSVKRKFFPELHDCVKLLKCQ